MSTYYGVDTHRIVYKASEFETGLTVTGYLWSPALVKSDLQTFTELSDGLYYLDYVFSALGTYIGLFYEDDVAKVSGAFRVVSGANGSNAIVIHVETDEGASIIDVTVEVWNSDSTVYVTESVTDAEGDVSFQLSNGDYQIRCRKGGVSFTVPEDITISEAATHDIIGTIEIGLPIAPFSCRVYEYCYLGDGTTPCTSVVGTARIVSIPFDSGSILHAGDEIDGTYDSDTGLLYWDLVHEAVVRIDCETILGDPENITIPESDTARLADLLP